ncbi:glycosyltransferase family 2 protein [Flavobacterium bomense]|uniref:Glycosyltransferase family 2 protein n=1 Tax=Flavobacterium bomense TaxID=2497483 RepID=A0A3S0PJG1_9FLAO|nr:glycosyltransferase family 2 protein [Flavobacterium bomense]RTZ06497.1 glycosyltransferase family 2 protein [Flavobacterium bomense]
MSVFPKVTIIMATYNRAHFILETLQSIQTQTFDNWECLIIDDGGSDNTREVIAPILVQDDRFQFLKRPEPYEKGLPGCRNYGLDIAKGAFIQFFDDDDLMHPRKLELQLAPFFKNDKLNFTACKFETLFESESGSKKIMRPDFNFEHPHLGDAILLGDLRINSLSTLWNIKILNQFRFDETLMYAEEWELFTRIGYQYPNNYCAVDEYLFSYRKHSTTLTQGEDLYFEKRKTSSIIRIKILNYLSENKLHTKKSILFLAKTFFVITYNPIYIHQLIDYIEVNKGFTFKLLWFLKSGLIFAKFYSKFIGKLASWV